MVNLHRLGGIADAETGLEFSLENPVELRAGKDEEIVRPVVDVRNVHRPDLIGNEKACPERNIRNHLRGIEENHPRAGVAVPVILVVCLNERVELPFERSQFRTPP